MRNIMTTFFHVPGGEPYHLGRAGQGGQYGGTVEEFVFLPPGTMVTIHGHEGMRYKVAGYSFHVGQPDEDEGMHIFLEEAVQAARD